MIRITSFSRGFVARLRDAWVILGLTIVLCLALEALYRGQALARRKLRRDTPVPAWADPNHPNAREPWWQEIGNGGFGEGIGFRYDPFRGWWARPLRSRYINVDDEGRRVTVTTPVDSGSRRLVYMFGGSSMWGWIVRDSFTVPSLVASRLRTIGYKDVEIVNLAQSTFDLAQNAATLQQALRIGRIPTIAVFLDGNNEIAPVFQSGELGRILNEALIARRFERREALRVDLMSMVRRSELVQRLTRRDAPRPGARRFRLCDGVAGSYARQTRAITAVAEEFHVYAFFFWQPMRATSRKRLTRWERDIQSADAWPEMVRRCTAAVDSAIALQPGAHYYPLHSLFDGDTASVFTDDYGHVTERANGAIADHIAALIARRLGPP